MLACGTPEEGIGARLTMGFEKRDGKWLITHEHHSAALPLPDSDAAKKFKQRLAEELPEI